MVNYDDYVPEAEYAEGAADYVANEREVVSEPIEGRELENDLGALSDGRYAGYTETDGYRPDYDARLRSLENDGGVMDEDEERGDHHHHHRHRGERARLGEADAIALDTAYSPGPDNWR